MRAQNRLVRYLLLIVFCLAGVSLLRAEEAGGESKARIEALISHVQSLKGATFIRNGSEYDSKSAAKFLKGKWDANRKEIHTPSEFIEKVATKSSTTGKPYVIRLQDGKETPCGPYLTAQLKKLEAGPPPK